MDMTFGPEHRLHDNRDYSRIFHRQQKVAGRHLVVLLRPRDRREASHARIGVMISAKTAPLSVRRHQLKRWVRESFRQHLKALLLGHDAVVLFRNNPPIDAHAIIDAELRYLVPKALLVTAHPGSQRKPTNDSRPRAPHQPPSRREIIPPKPACDP